MSGSSPATSTSKLSRACMLPSDYALLCSADRRSVASVQLVIRKRIPMPATSRRRASVGESYRTQCLPGSLIWKFSAFHSGSELLLNSRLGRLEAASKLQYETDCRCRDQPESPAALRDRLTIHCSCRDSCCFIHVLPTALCEVAFVWHSSGCSVRTSPACQAASVEAMN